LKSAVDGRGIDPLIHDNEINILLFKSLNNYRQINDGTSKLIKLGDNKNVFLPDKVESTLQLRSIFGRAGRGFLPEDTVTVSKKLAFLLIRQKGYDR